MLLWSNAYLIKGKESSHFSSILAFSIFLAFIFITINLIMKIVWWLQYHNRTVVREHPHRAETRRQIIWVQHLKADPMVLILRCPWTWVTWKRTSKIEHARAPSFQGKYLVLCKSVQPWAISGMKAIGRKDYNSRPALAPPQCPPHIKSSSKSPVSSPNTMAWMPHWGHFRHLGSFLWLHDVSEKFSVLAISMLFRRKPELPEILNSDIKWNSKLSIDEEVEGNDEITTYQKLSYSSSRKKCSLTLLRSLAGPKN